MGKLQNFCWDDTKKPNLSQNRDQIANSIPTCSPSRDVVDIMAYVKDINQPSLPTHLYSVLVSISVFMSLSTVFLSINYTDNSSLSHSVLLVLFLPYWSFQLYISL